MHDILSPTSMTQSVKLGPPGAPHTKFRLSPLKESPSPLPYSTTHSPLPPGSSLPYSASHSPRQQGSSGSSQYSGPTITSMEEMVMNNYLLQLMLQVKPTNELRHGLARTSNSHISENHPYGNPDDYILGGNALYDLTESPSISGCSSPSQTESLSFSVQSNGWTTGNTTERSSIYSATSWGDDEFDRQASTTVKNLFEEIDSVLFEGTHTVPQNVIYECQDWLTQFPHLRVLGYQTIAPQDQGYESIPNETIPPVSNLQMIDVTEHDLTSTQEPSGLAVMGRHVQAVTPPRDNEFMPSSPKENSFLIEKFAHYEEDVYAEDGHYEDVIAMDYRLDREEGPESRSKKSPRRKRHGYPPMSPNANARDTVACTVFDNYWNTILSQMELVLGEYKRQLASSESHLEDSFLPPAPGIDIIPPSRETIIGKKNSSMSDEHTSKLPSMMSYIQDPILEDPSQPGNLRNLMLISSMPLFKRENSGFQESDIFTRQGSMLSLGMRPYSTSQSRTINSAQTRKKLPSRLAPLSSDRVRTPNIDEEPFGAGIQGHRLQPATERLTTPPSNSGYNLARNSALPPIGLDTIEPPQAVPKHIRKGNRASSAIAEKDARINAKEREKSAVNYSLDTRPSTTHTFRSDTPLGNRRSSTPMGFNANNSRSNLHNAFSPSQVVRDVGLGITGSSISHSQTNQDSAVNQIQELEEEEHDYHNSWAPSSHISPNNPYRKHKHVNFVR